MEEGRSEIGNLKFLTPVLFQCFECLILFIPTDFREWFLFQQPNGVQQYFKRNGV